MKFDVINPNELIQLGVRTTNNDNFL